MPKSVASIRSRPGYSKTFHGTHKWIIGTVVEDARTNERRVAILPDRGQTDAGGSYISHKVPRFRDPSQVQRLIE